MTRNDAFGRLAGVREELYAAKLSLENMQWVLAAGQQPIPPTSSVRPVHIRTCLEKVEMTYFLRLFTEFEAVLRNYWSAARPGRKRRLVRMEILIDRIAVLRTIPWDPLHAAHAVRHARNAITHDMPAENPLTFQQCSSRLATFVSYLPLSW